MTNFALLYDFFWVIPRRLNFICRRFGTLYLFHLHRPIRLWGWNRQSVPKRRHIKFRRRGITQKKSYNIQNTAKVWNQISCFCHIFREPLSQHVRSTSWRQQVQTPAVMTKTFNFYSRLPIHCHHCFSEKLLILLLLSPCTINNPSYIVYLGEDGKNMRDLERYLLLFAYCFLSLFIFTDWRWYEWVI